MALHTNTNRDHPLLPLISDRKKLESLAEKFGTPLYVYQAERLQENIKRLDNALKQSIENYRICYALKANTNPHIVSTLFQSVPSMGADCSSPGELYVAQKVGIPPDACIYTGNYESPTELETALNSGVHLNLDDITSYKRLKKIGLPKELSFRLNPGFGEGRFPAIVTAGHDAKFGVPREKIIDAYRHLTEDGIKQFGLQCMTGSGNLKFDYFIQLLKTILEIASSIERELSLQINYISMGGGLGIPYREEEEPLNVHELFKGISEVFVQYYGNTNSEWPTLIIEPGKYLVADAGFVLSRVVGLKESYKNFVGLDAGMNTLLRPALYNAYHRIYKVGNPLLSPIHTVDVTGGICENTDRLAIDRLLPDLSEGDLVAIMDAGAYGFVMATQYNTRPRPAEVLLINGAPKLIRQSESLDDIFRLCNWDRDTEG